MGSADIVGFTGHPAEVSEHLLDTFGPVDIATSVADDGTLTAEVASETDAAVEAALVGFVPTSDPAEGFKGKVAPALRPHVPHLRDFVAAVGTGATITNAQRDHVIADVILALRVLVDDRLD